MPFTTLDPNPVSPVFGNPPLPEWVKGFRDHQVVGIEETLYHLHNGSRVVLMNAPTGSGKTLMAETIRRGHPAGKALYVCTTKTLQDQFAEDFPYAKVLKGRRNYPTLDFPEMFNDPFKPITAGDCMKDRVTLPACSGCNMDEETVGDVLHCENCHPWYLCPYEVAKREAFASEIAVTNTAFFLSEANGPGKLSEQGLIIVDECDTLESLLMGQVEVEVSERMRKRLELGFPSKKTVESAWFEWVMEAAPVIAQAAAEADKLARQRRTKDAMREAQALGRLSGRIGRLRRQIAEGEDSIEWIYDGKAAKEGKVIFRPVKVDALGEEMLWRHGNQFVLMSASIIDPVEFTESLGLYAGWDIVNVPNTFPKENRPIHVIGGPSMAKKAIDESEGRNIDEMAALVSKVITKHPGERILVHTVSYKLAQDLFDRLRGEHGPRLVVYGSGEDREKALAYYKEKADAVALAPSWDRGVDLPGDLCTVQVIAKVPFPNLGDPQVAKRLYGFGRAGDQWFAVQTVRTIVQMLGRGVRSKDDFCRTYILDSQFMWNVWNKNRMLIPAYLREAIDFSGGVL